MGINPILIIRFYPGSESYKKFGESIHLDIRFTEHDLASIIKCLIANKPKTAGALKFKFAFGSVYENFVPVTFMVRISAQIKVMF